MLRIAALSSALLITIASSSLSQEVVYAKALVKNDSPFATILSHGRQVAYSDWVVEAGEIYIWKGSEMSEWSKSFGSGHELPAFVNVSMDKVSIRASFNDFAIIRPGSPDYDKAAITYAEQIAEIRADEANRKERQFLNDIRDIRK